MTLDQFSKKKKIFFGPPECFIFWELNILGPETQVSGPCDKFFVKQITYLHMSIFTAPNKPVIIYFKQCMLVTF